MNSTPQHTHTQLYIVVGLLVIFAILFFMFTTEKKITPFPTNIDSTPLQLKRIILSADQIAAKEAVLSDPALTKQAALSKSQAAAKEKLLDDPLLKQSAAH